MIAVSVLGSVQLHRDGEPVPVRPGKTTEVLIRLALEAGMLVRTERLIEDLWADEAFGTARNTLQTKVSRLRRALGSSALVTGTSKGYTLEIEPEAVDALRVLRLAERASALRAAGNHAPVLEACASALALFRGDVLVDAGDGEWLIPHRVRLEEVRLALVEGHVAARLELGASGEVTAELEGLVRQHPLREGLWALLMTALYREGRQADALAAYTRVRGQLAEALGLDPGPALQALEERVLLHDPLLDVRRLAGSRAPAGPAPGNLPGLLSTMVGRAADLEAVSRLVGQDRLVTVVGPAGVGKTRLAVDVARRDARSGGAWLVRLDTARDAASATHAMAEALGVARATEAMVIDHLRGQDVLLVLDNCEQVVQPVAEIVTRLLDAAPWLTILCTSQVRLGLDGEATYPLEPLDIDDSVQLFTRLAVGHRRSFTNDGDSHAVIGELCRSLDGLPLAIELAAARARTLPVEEIARRLNDRFSLLTDPTSHGPERRRALGAAIGWSYDLLFPDDQRGLCALACFSGGAPLPALVHVLGALDVPEASAVDVVGRLADRSLVVAEVLDGDVRYRLLDSIRAFALDRLHEAGLAHAALGAHAQWFGDAAAEAVEGVRGPEQASHLALARAERANIDAALNWAVAMSPELGLRIATGFAWAWFVLGDRPLGTERLGRALAAAKDLVPPSDLVKALCLAAWLASNDIGRAQADAEQAMAMAAAAGDEHLCAISRAAMAFVLLQQARPNDALDLLAPCPAVHERLGGQWEEGAAWILTAHAALALGDTARAGRACQAADQLLRDFGDDWAEGHLDGALGFLAQTEGRFTDAATHLRRAADAAGRLRFPATQGLHLATLGRILQQAGDPVQAVAALEQAIEIGRATKDMRVVALARTRLGRVLRAEGEQAAAKAAVQAADHWFRSSGGGEGTALAAFLAAAIAAEEGEPTATPQLHVVLTDAQHREDWEIQVLTLDALARSSAGAGDDVAAHELLDRADQLMPSAHHLISESDRIDAAAARALMDRHPLPRGRTHPRACSAAARDD